MPWTADVPFPAEDLAKCRGCGQTIGWIQREDKNTGERRPHPVDPKGWHGAPCGESTLGAKRGYTTDGDRASVIAFPDGQLFAPTGVAVFTSHFVTCPERANFYKSNQQGARR